VADADQRADVIAERFASLPVEVRREVISSLMDIQIMRAARWGRHVFDPTRVVITWK
jgi:hypothetical protein